MPKPSTNAANRPWEGLIFFSLLALVLYVVYFRNFTQMGLYEDDWSAIAPYANGNWSVVWSQIRFWLTHWPNGRPLGLSTCAAAGWCLYKIGGLAALYLIPYSIVLACSWTIFRILRDSLGLVAAFLGALTFALLPTDTLRLSLHGAPHLYLAALCMLLAIRALQCRMEWAAAPLTFLGLLFHESSTLTIFLGPLLFCTLSKDFLWRTLRYWGFVSLGILTVFFFRVFVFAEERAASTFSNFRHVLQRCQVSLEIGTKTHYTLLLQRCREGFQFPVSGSLLAFIFILAIIVLVLAWQWMRGPDSHHPDQPRGMTPLKAVLFGGLAFAVPYLAYFTDPYWPANHVAGRMASVHSASGVGFAFVLAGVAGLLQLIPWAALRLATTALLVIPLSALLSWGSVVRSQYLEAWENQRTFWTVVNRDIGNIKANTVIFVQWDTFATPPFTWVIGSNSWADSIVLRHIYAFPQSGLRDPRLFKIIGPWEQSVRVENGKFLWDMPAGDWLPETIELEPGNLMIFRIKDGIPVPEHGSVRINETSLVLMEPTDGRPPDYPTTPLFKDLIKVHK